MKCVIEILGKVNFSENQHLRPFYCLRLLFKDKKNNTLFFFYKYNRRRRRSGVTQLSNSLRPHGLQPTRLFHPWDFPGKTTGVGCHFLLQGIFPTQGLNPGLLHCRQVLYHLSHQGSPINIYINKYIIYCKKYFEDTEKYFNVNQKHSYLYNRHPKSLVIISFQHYFLCIV